jgi:hypothetical protein
MIVHENLVILRTGLSPTLCSDPYIPPIFYGDVAFHHLHVAHFSKLHSAAKP